MADTPKRKSTRFVSDPPMAAIVNGHLPAIAFSEAAKGCGLMMVTKEPPRQGEEISVTLANMAPVKGVVRWATALDQDIIKIGIEYLE
jgi:hypothetical protein